jgi:RNA polymerase sigma factor (sigma-70 family)
MAAADEGVDKAFAEHEAQLLAMLRWRMSAALAARLAPEEVLQNARLKALRRWNHFPPTLSPYARLYRLTLDCLHAAYAEHTSQRRDFRQEVRCPEDGSSAFWPAGTDTSPSNALARKELQEQVWQIMAQLRPDDQELLRLRYVDRLSTEDIARVLGITPNTARQRFARARLRFKDLWQSRVGPAGAEP